MRWARPIRSWTRRGALAGLAGALAAVATRARAAAPAVPAEHREFVAAAFKMKDEAVRLGDQPYGAVVVKDGRIIGFGPSRVVLKKDVTAHAEREAIREAQARLGTSDLGGGAALFHLASVRGLRARRGGANISRMIHGADAADGGPPRR